MISAAQVGWSSDMSLAIYPIAEALMETNIAMNKTLDIYCGFTVLHFCFVPHLYGSVGKFGGDIIF